MIRGFNIAVFISLVFGAIGYSMEGSPIRWFIVSFILQIAVTFLMNTAIRAWAQVQTNKLIADRENLIHRNTCVVKCAVCDEPHEMELSLALPNEYRCVKCKSLNSVGVSVSNVQKTEIIPEGVITTDILSKISETANLSG